MKTHVHSRIDRSAPAGRQRGAALLFIVLLLVMGVGIFVVSGTQETARVVQSDKHVVAGLNAAKESLIAYAVAHPTRPGALPCPDAVTNIVGNVPNDGIADVIVGNACPSYIGRLPWRTLGLGDMRDEAGERYWYALSDNFRDFAAISSDTKGNRIVRSGTAAVTQTSDAVAVVFAPGGVLSGQVRDETPVACLTTGTTIPQDRCAANYLETADTVNNAATPGTGPYIAAEPNASFNDRLVMLRTSDLIPLVELRVAGDIRKALLLYREASRNAIAGGGCNCYPWADSNNNGSSNVGVNKGRIPLTASPHDWSPQPPAPPNTLTDGTNVYPLPSLPPYFQANNWHTVIFYAVGRNALQNFGLAPTACTTCSGDPLLPPPVLLKGSLSVDKGIGHAVVLITTASAGASRPSTNWGDYIDDGVNRDGDDRFVVPLAKTLDRDRLLTIPDDVYPASCNTGAKILIKNAPCHTTGNNVKPVCNKAASNLQFCSMCSGDATVMITTPCRNTLNPNACQNAVATLQGCKA